ncbi:N-acetyl-1-D-myo-inositol-2-amino-2-deoxy-alpha-D-glucopyranoside deacetylase [Haloglycomyces albus]|uniref:N-acetyl-1-D-myo-inositol-2-amino-2-deoxy-alpha- D-glucopyranoside deacetylase n=1 Tax=Haloglycomyces albus TaxID=526067 RepID=UPI00046D256D|nr:N-acetyl-1-D-myo-inositol-2-amino-2-deoxy-alpha-D-glucopyranoside deacetylase [Haloglycomyces albus]
MSSEGILFVHAHPDDETVATGATIAHYANRPGVDVTVVTCTLGEEGEVRVPELQGLAAHASDQLGGWRLSEYLQAMDALGVDDWHFLGGIGRWRDSGMMGERTNDHPHCFWKADVDYAAFDLVRVIRQRQPEVLITYDPNGDYGHPDHIQAHRVAMRAAELAADPNWSPELGAAHEIRKIYWKALPDSVMRIGFDKLHNSSDNPFAEVEAPEDVPFATPDADISARIRTTSDNGERKLQAMRAYRTQIAENDWLWVLTATLGDDTRTTEYYRLVKGDRGQGSGPYDWEGDLLS